MWFDKAAFGLSSSYGTALSPLTVRPHGLYPKFAALTISPVATPIFSTVGVPFGMFLAAAILSVPKTFVPVYVGWTAKPENDGTDT
jgi:hypothetical protein